MRRAYTSFDCDPADSIALARDWSESEGKITVIGRSTSDIAATPWLERTGLPLGTTSHRHSRFTARARTGYVVAWFLTMDELLQLERHGDLHGVVLVGARASHAPWIQAHGAEHLGGDPVAPIEEACEQVKTVIKKLSLMAVLNQGLIDSRERSMVVEALTYMRDHEYLFRPNQLTLEAIRNQWHGTSPMELAKIGRALNEGKRLKYESRLGQRKLAEWVSGDAPES